MLTEQQNFTVVVNWKKRGFGCAKAYSYCNWRTSPYLPHGGQDPSAISAFIRQCKKSFITISGGADPLYKFDENRDQLLSMVQTIRAHGFRVRVITREVPRSKTSPTMSGQFCPMIRQPTSPQMKATT